MATPMSAIYEHLVFVYGEGAATEILPQIEARLAQFRREHPQLSALPLRPTSRLTERD